MLLPIGLCLRASCVSGQASGSQARLPHPPVHMWRLIQHLLIIRATCEGPAKDDAVRCSNVGAGAASPPVLLSCIAVGQYHHEHEPHDSRKYVFLEDVGGRHELLGQHAHAARGGASHRHLMLCILCLQRSYQVWRLHRTRKVFNAQ